MDEFFTDSTSVDDLRKKLEDLENSIGGLNPRNLAGIKSKDLRQATRSNLFGDGSDDNVVISANTSLSRDMFYNNLTVNSGYTLNPNGFRVFVKDDLTNNGTISVNGGAGGNGGNGGNGNTSSAPVGGTAGSAGAAAHSSGSLPASPAGKAGGVGGAGITDTALHNGFVGNGGTAGDSSAKSLGAAGSGGGGAGAGGNATYAGTGTGGGGGSGAAGGSQTGTVFNTPRSPSSALNLFDTQPSDTFAVLHGSAGSGSGAGGGGGACSGFNPDIGAGAAGGGGGGSGAPGGIAVIFAGRIINNGVISANGGNGGLGGNGGNGAHTGGVGCGGGGGAGGPGAGGPGGVIILVYGEKSGTGTITATGGTAGANTATAGTGSAGGSASATSGATASAATDGATGTIINISI